LKIKKYVFNILFPLIHYNLNLTDHHLAEAQQWRNSSQDRVLDAASRLLKELGTLLQEHRVLFLHTATVEERERGENLLRVMQFDCGVNENYFLQRVAKSEAFLEDARGDANWERSDAEFLLKQLFNRLTHFETM
jgi:hypothetical protein